MYILHQNKYMCVRKNENNRKLDFVKTINLFLKIKIHQFCIFIIFRIGYDAQQAKA